MVTVPIPTAEEARDLRAMFDGNFIINRARVALFTYAGHVSAEQAAALLPMWQHYKELSPREVAAVLAFLMERPS